MLTLLLVISLAVCATALIYSWFTINWCYWEKRGVPFLKPVFPFGSAGDVFSGGRSYDQIQTDIYMSLKGCKVGGLYVFRMPVLFAMDPSIVYTIMINDFAHFSDRGFNDSDDLDPLSATNLINIRAKRWRVLRTRFAPAFSPSKLKSIHNRIIECTQMLAEDFERSRPTFSVKELTSEFALNLMGSVLLSVPRESLVDPKSHFKIIIHKTFENSFLLNIRSIFRYVCPYILKLTNWKRFPKRLENFFIDFILQRVNFKAHDKEEINDLLEYFLGPPEEDGDNFSRLKGVSLTELAANTYGVFAAGVETTGSVLAYALFELSKNQDMQEKLYNEISSVLPKHGNEPTFDALKDFKYLDQVLSETLRKYPSLQATSRECTKEYKFPDSDFTVEKGIKIIIPILALHYDPAYFPDPHKFDPERFSDENKAKIIKGSYLPFGDGPRVCIGQRLAKIELKVALITLLMRFKFSINRKMIQPLTFRPRSIFLVPKHPILLDVTPRTNDEINKNL